MKRVRGPAVIAAVVAVAVTGTSAAQAVVGGTPAGDTHQFVARVQVGTGTAARACTGALIAPQWIVTARSCFASGDRPAGLGAPTEVARVTVGGRTAPVVWLAPHPDRDVLLAKLVAPVAGVAPVAVATIPAAAGDTLQLAGLGRTRDEWVPDAVHAADFTVTEAGTTTLTLEPAGDEGAICKGDAGGPALRTTGSGRELVAVHQSSWQGGCIGNTAETRRTAVDARLDDLGGWIRSTLADVGIYGARADGRLTYSVIDSASGDRLTTVTSAASLGFAPKAMAALNATTLLVTSPAGRLHRVDITANNPVLTFGTPVDLGGGWVHELLSYDGDGTLYGIAGSLLRRYTVTTAKPARAGHIINYTTIDDGFSLKSLTATGPDWILGTTAAGALRSYRIPPAGGWEGVTLATNATWASLTHLVSPGRGLYYGRTPSGGMLRFRDPAPFDKNGADLQSFPADPVDTSGWDTVELAAVPFTTNPQSTVDVSIFGTTADGRLTWSAIESSTGDRQTTVTSEATLGFAPEAMATLNYNTVLITSTGGRLFRVDVLTTTPELTFAQPVDLAGGWTHRLLAYDGRGSLYGIAGSTLRRYTVTAAKPGAAQITANTMIDDGFGLTTLAATAPGWILGATGAGELVSYRILGAGAWERHSLRTGWPVAAALTSPGNGLYYARTAAGALHRYLDANPVDGIGTDITSFPADPVDTSGWNQELISAQPFIG